ncbi:potassium channel family protein [Ilumatobacter sp.]|uniref:potassium channel family protein n=1 Tax=Ilumatobacter sp. TaxID=1967498 RepID=UPI003C3FC4ED
MRNRLPWTPGLDRFGALLFFLLVAFLFSGATDHEWPTIIGSFANLASLVVGFSSTGLRDNGRRTAFFAALGVIGIVLISVFEPTSTAAGVGALLQALVLGAILGALVRRVLQHQEVTLATILGVISAYVLIGLIFAWIYLAMVGFQHEAVLDPPSTGLPVYYSFVVISTLGFGDIHPIDDISQRISALEAVVGQIFLATVVARFVSLYGKTPPAHREASEPETD